MSTIRTAPPPPGLRTRQISAIAAGARDLRPCHARSPAHPADPPPASLLPSRMGPLTPDELERVLAEAVRRLRAAFDPCTSYLFGSYAEGERGTGATSTCLSWLRRLRKVSRVWGARRG